MTRRRAIALAVSSILVAATIAISSCDSRGEGIPVATSVHGFTLADISGKPHPLAQYQGKALLIVNVASQCGYTGQYAALQALYEKYRERGFVIIGVPSNDFLWQESGSNEQIAQFCSTTYGVKFPMMAKLVVTGSERDPLYWYLTRDSARPGKIGWNFTKFLIGKDGKVVERFGPSTEPDAAEVLAALEKALTSVP